jgi:probable HAF family extracellular repeat protein
VICAIACFASVAIAQTRYQITRIPAGANSAALGLNDKGEVVGYSFQGDDYQAFLFSYADKSMTEIGSLGGKLNAACAINAAGQVTGYSQDANGNLLAFIFSRNAPIASLGALEGGSTSEAFGINNRGEVVGDSQSGNQNHRPVLFSNNAVQDLGLGGSSEPGALETAYAINDSGQIVGRHSAGNNAFHAFLSSQGNTTDFNTLGGANGEALGINKHGHLVGDSDTADGAIHAFLFDGSLKDLGTLPGYENASYARGINNSGEIVGESDSADQKRAFVYRKGQLVQLDALAQNLNEAGFASLDVAYDINDKGWIVGYGTTSDNLTAAFVAVPERAGRRVARKVPAPPSQVRKQKQLQAEEPEQSEAVLEPDEDDYDLFYSRLSPEGSWIEAGNYGYCFRPRVARDWRPYRDGHWVWTDRGWYWDSNERFGWATYHYGRWIRIGGTGWCWVPGHQWAPAWVSWRESDEHVGWAPLPPEADVSVNVSISSWSDSYYDIGPSAYSFIRYAHWSAPSYVRYCEPPAQNVQIINRTKNVTNIVNNNTVINNYGPPVQTVSAKTKQNIQEVKLAVNPATGPNANYSQTLKGNQLNVVAPPPVLKPAAKQAPPVQTRLANPVVEKGWQGVKPADAAKLKKTIVQQNPPPKDLPKPTPLPTQRILKKGQVVGSPTPPGSPAPVPGQKQTPPSMVKPTASPGEKVPAVKATPGGSPQAPAAAQKPVPPNLIGARPTGTPGASPVVKPAGTPGASPAAAGGRPVPATTPGPQPSPTAQPAVKPGGTPGVSPATGSKPPPPTTPGPQPSLTVKKPSALGTVPPGLPGGKTAPASKVGAKQSPAGGKPSSTAPVPGGSPNVPKSTPPNLNAAKPPPSPQTTPAATPTSKPGVVPPGQGPRPAATPGVVGTPVPEKKSEAAPAPTPQSQPANLATPKPTPASIPAPTPQVKAPPQQPTSAPKPPPVAAPKPTPQAQAPAPKPQPQATAPAPKPQPQAKAPAPKPQPQVKAPAPKPQPQVKAPAPKPQPQVKAPAPKPQPQVKAPAPKPQPQVKAPAPKPQPQVKAPAPKPPQQKPSVQKSAPAKASPTPQKK